MRPIAKRIGGLAVSGLLLLRSTIHGQLLLVFNLVLLTACATVPPEPGSLAHERNYYRQMCIDNLWVDDVFERVPARDAFVYCDSVARKLTRRRG